MSRPREQAGPSEKAPLLRVVKGDPTAEELAALTVVLTARRRVVNRPEPVRSAWSQASRAVRTPQYPEPRGWRASALPR